MNVDDICNLQVSDITDKNSILFLWCTWPTIEDGFKVISSWGFKYKTCAFTWVKTNRKSDSLFWGMGYWTRSNTEIVLLATKGSPKRQKANIHQVITAPIGEHSKKPDIVRNKIVELCGNLPRIELFGRRRVEGWDVWGNQVDKFEPVITVKNSGLESFFT